MKKILFTLVFTLFYLPLCGFSQSDIHTPNKSEPAAFKLAKVYFLPDWSDKGMSFDGTDEKPCTEACPQKTSYDCASGQTETYTNSCGLTCSRCVECYGCEAKGYTLTNCPANASCLNDCCNNLYKLVSCDSGYVLDGSSCRKETCSDNPNICTGGKTCISGSCQCPNGKTEVSGKCETSTCKNGGITCSGSAGVCNETTGKCVQCLTNSDCGGGKECNANNQCIVPDACAGVTCNGGKSCVDGICVCPSNQVDNNGTCEAPNCVNGGVTCSAGQTCNTTTKLCEAEKEETCRTQAEAKGWTLITSEAEFTEALSAEKAKLAFSGNVRSRALSALVKASAATLADAATVVGGLCTEPGSIDLKALHTNTIMSIEVPGTIEFLSGGTNSEITLRANNFVVDKLSCTKSSNCLFNLKGEEVYIEELDAFPLSTIKVYGNAVGNRYYEEYETVLNDSTLYTTNIDMIKLQGGSNLTLYSGMAIGTIEMTGLSQSLTRLTFADGGFFISRPYKAEYQNSGTFLEAINCQYYMCQINVGEVSNASLNLNQRDLRFGITSGSYYNEGGNMYVYINSSVLKNVGSIADASSSNKPHVHFTLNYYDLTPIIQFTNGDSISKPTEAVDWICNFDLSGRISSASQCTPTSATSGNIGTCKCDIK